MADAAPAPQPPPPAELAAAATALLAAVRSGDAAQAGSLLEQARAGLAGGGGALLAAAEQVLQAAGEPLRVLHLAARADGGVSASDAHAAGVSEQGVAQVVELLLAQLPPKEVDRGDRSGLTPLHHACLAGRHPAAAALLTRGADADAETAALDTPLHLACLGGHAETAALLLGWGGAGAGATRLRAINRDGWTAFHLAIMTGQRPENQATVSMLLSQPAPPLDAVSFDGWSPTLLAASRGMDTILTSLLAAGARHDLTREKGETALHLAALGGEPECVVALLKAGASAVAKDADGNLPLHLAAFGGCGECVGALVRTDPRTTGAVNRKGDAPLHIAAAKAHTEAVLQLLGAGDTRHACPLADVFSRPLVDVFSRKRLASLGRVPHTSDAVLQAPPPRRRRRRPRRRRDRRRRSRSTRRPSC